MENKLEIFKNKEFGEIRTIEEEGKVLFCGSDVAKALGYANSNKAINDHCRAITKRSTPISGKMQEINFITESDLYRLIVSSKLESAQKFESWVFDEILPTIRKTGGYVASEELFVNTYLPFADEMTKQLFSQTLKTVKEQNRLIIEMKPKAEYFDELVDRNLLTNFRDTAKELHISPSKFNQFLIESKYIYRDTKGRLKPYQNYKTQGLFELKEYYNIHSGHTDVQTMITPKGRETFRLLFNYANQNYKEQLL